MAELEPLLVGPAEVGRLLGCSRARAYEVIKAGVLGPALLINGRTKIPTAAVRAYVDRLVAAAVENDAGRRETERRRQQLAARLVAARRQRRHHDATGRPAVAETTCSEPRR